MKKNKKDDYDVNNSMENSNEESHKKSKKNKKNKKEKIESKSKNTNYNILDEIKKEDESNQKEKILEEVNNTMIRDNNKKQKKERKKEIKKEENTEEEEEKEKEKEKEKENNKEKYKEKKESEKEKEKTKPNKKSKKANNILSDTFNEIANELNEQMNLEIENIFEINKKFNYPKDSPVFYIRDDSSNNDLYSYPLSTLKIKDLLKKKEIKPFLVKVKLIDIFTMKNYEPFSFFDFNDILAKNWSKNVEYSSIFLNEYNNMYEKNMKNNIEEKNKNLEISYNTNEYIAFPKKEKKLKFDDNKKVEKNKKQEEKNDMTLNFNISEIDKKGFNDFSISIIKQLEGVNLTKKKMEKITSIIEEVEEEQWTEIKSKKKEKEQEKKPDNYIVGLNESRQIQESEVNTNKKKNRKKKKKQFVNFNNRFAGLKVDLGSDDDEEDEK